MFHKIHWPSILPWARHGNLLSGQKISVTRSRSEFWKIYRPLFSELGRLSSLLKKRAEAPEFQKSSLYIFQNADLERATETFCPDRIFPWRAQGQNSGIYRPFFWTRAPQLAFSIASWGAWTDPRFPPPSSPPIREGYGVIRGGIRG